jgi:hypothetical protein
MRGAGLMLRFAIPLLFLFACAQAAIWLRRPLRS